MSTPAQPGLPLARARHERVVPGDRGRRLSRPLSAVLGRATAAALEKLGPRTEEDLLRHYPRRYGDRGRLTDLASLVPGEHVTVIARVESTEVRPMRSRSGAILTSIITDGRTRVELTFFGKHRGSLTPHERRLRVGESGMFTGTVKLYRGNRQLTHPDYTTFRDFDEEAAALERVDWPIPIYPASASIPTWRVAQSVRTVLGPLREEDVPEPLPADYLRAHRLPGALEALRLVHEPHATEDWRRGLHRLRHEEAFVLQTALALRRAAALASPATARPRVGGGILDAFDAALPFRLTAGQREVAEVVAAELGGRVPMQRLLQGEVGSGKTVVALRAMLQVVDAGGQAALLAPTEVLAHQHHRSITALLGPLAEAGMLGGDERATRVVLLTGSLGAARRREALAQVASGEAGIIIGTHALLGEQVRPADLGLVVVDEQHRFGVEQRDALRGKADAVPHLLVMTATPIPRTVAMTTFGDLETSTLRELPAGRAGVDTHIRSAGNTEALARIWRYVRDQVDGGGRAYVICPRISAEEEDADQVDDGDDPFADLLALAADTGDAPGERPAPAAVEEVAETLAADPVLAGVRVGRMHGRLPAEQKDAAMADFASGAAPVLVSTTVVEVGVDVPEATVMVILDADRFGLSQLHQLRGRIGRGSRPGMCIAVTHAVPDSPAGTRLAAFAATTDGFVLADADLELRREGDVLGASQSGRSSSLRLLRVRQDGDIIEAARTAAREVVAQDPDLAGHPDLGEVIAGRVDEETAAYLERA